MADSLPPASFSTDGRSKWIRELDLIVPHNPNRLNKTTTRNLLSFEINLLSLSLIDIALFVNFSYNIVAIRSESTMIRYNEREEESLKYS